MTQVCTLHLPDLCDVSIHRSRRLMSQHSNARDSLLESALLQNTTARFSLSGWPSTSCSCTANRYRCPMCSGPKSAWKALYNKVRSMEK